MILGISWCNVVIALCCKIFQKRHLVHSQQFEYHCQLAFSLTNVQLSTSFLLICLIYCEILWFLINLFKRHLTKKVQSIDMSRRSIVHFLVRSAFLLFSLIVLVKKVLVVALHGLIRSYPTCKVVEIAEGCFLLITSPCINTVTSAGIYFLHILADNYRFIGGCVRLYENQFLKP